MSFPSKILASLSASSGVTARDIASRFNVAKSEVNPHLYRMLGQKKVIQKDLKWYLAGDARNTTIAPDPPPRAAEKRPEMVVARDAAKIVWSSQQKAIIEASPSDRILVEAGPGTGKTAVACARVAKLLKEDELTPGSILMISFTRTAVAEMKNRIRLWADSGRVGAVNICTLDQAAFSFGIGCGEKFERLMSGFDNNIQNALEQFRSKNALLAEYAAGIRHLIVDEAQDLTGLRSQLVRLLIQSLSSTAGVTIFADRAQAIYGFTTDIDGDPESGELFLQAFDPAKEAFRREPLDVIHRTQVPVILKLFTEARLALTKGTIDDVIKVAESTTQCLGSEVQKLPLKDGDLVLFRTRASALMQAQFCPKLFRLRLPNHPPAIFPWIALIFSRWEEPRISQQQFGALWGTHVPAVLRDGFTAESAWGLLYRFAKEREHVKTSRLRTLLARSRPPVEFCYLDYGSVGPVFSTIHASKGREADRVFLMLPRNLDYLDRNSKMDRAEEARVFYVGATRVRTEFLRGTAQTLAGARRIDRSGRRVGQIPPSMKKLPKFQFGLAGDLDDVAPVSREKAFCASDAQAVSNQQQLVDMWTAAVERDLCPEVTGKCDNVTLTHGAAEYRYSCSSGTTPPIAWSGPSLHKDLWEACKLMKQRVGCSDLRPPEEIKRLRLIGLRTCAVGEDPAVLGNLRQPFAGSGFWLAPMIVGFSSIFLPFAKKPAR